MRKFYFLLISCFIFSQAFSQIEGDYIHMKGFSHVGLGAVLNLAFPTGESDFITVEGGVQYFRNKYDEELYTIPVLAGYRYTLDRSRYGFYLEPNAGYIFGASTVEVMDNDGYYSKLDPAGPAAGLTFGYLFAPARTQFNIGLRYEHGFAKDAVNLFSLRISHTFSFRRRDY